MNRLSEAQKRSTLLAKRELGRVWQQIDGMDPATQRDILLDMLPAIVHKYGDLDSTMAAEWYGQLWNKWFDGSFEAMPHPSYDDESMRSVIRANAGMLWPDKVNVDADPTRFLQWANGFLDRNVKNQGRSTIVANAKTDPLKPRWARVPSGGRTCAFCLMLASRGYAYHSEGTAGIDREFHDNDDCEIVPEWRQGANRIEGYAPDRYLALYNQAREILEHPGRMPDKLAESIKQGSTYTATITQSNGRTHSRTYDAGDPNNVNSLATVLRYLHPELFADEHGKIH